MPSNTALGAIAHFAGLTPQKTALIEPNGITLSYSQLWNEIEALSHRLQEVGIGFGEKVAVLLPQGALQVLAVTGVLNRHICLSLQSRTTVSEVKSSLRRMSAAALILAPEYEAEAEAALEMGVTVLVAQSGEPTGNWQTRTSGVQQPRSEQSSAFSNAVLYLITSATTDSSKIVPLTATNLDAGIAPRRDALRLTASDRLLLMTSIAHSMGIETALAQFLVGGTVIATAGFDPAAYLGWLNHLRPTWYDCAPAVHQAALVQLRSGPLDMPVSLRFVLSAGAPLPNEVKQELEQILERPVFNDYGMTETGCIAVDAFLSDRRVPNSAGRSCGLEIGIMGSSGELLQPGEEGEIVVRGNAVVAGYLDNSEANRSAFQDGWFKTGDLGRLDQEGNLFVTGRLKEMINRGGEKILPAEVDAVLASHPAVLDAAAFAVPHPSLGEDVACAVVLRASDGPPVSGTELRRFAAERLAAFKVPHRISVVDKIPRGEMGKPQRRLLADRLAATYAAPPSPTEVNQHLLSDGVFFETLHEIWARILERDDLGFNEDFFEAGGDSLAAINMLAEVDQRYGCQTSASAASFLDEPTLEHLAKLVGNPSPPRPSRDDASYMQIFPVRKGGASAQLFCVPTEGHEGLYFHRLATHLYGKLDLSIVRPANTFHSFALFALEREGKEVAEVIRRAQPEGPYFVSGYCYGGVIAAEAARQLSLDGQDVRVILFDVPMPGSPGILRDWPIWFDGAKRQWNRLWTSDHPGLIKNLRRLSHSLVWSALVPFRRLLVPVEHVTFIQWILTWARNDGFPLHKVRAVDVPFLHILCMDEPNILDSVSRFGWRRIARRGIEERFVAFNHQNIFHESNLPEMVEILLRWCGVPGNDSSR